MRYYEKVKKTIEENEPRGIQCNKCGEFFDPSDENIEQVNTTSGKYDVCKTCQTKIFKGFAIVPEGFMSTTPFYISAYELDHELHQKLFDEWKLTGIWNWDENPIRDAWMNREDKTENIEDDEEFFNELDNNKNSENS
jgi:hypothetical protein